MFDLFLEPLDIEVLRSTPLEEYFHEPECYYNNHVEDFYRYLKRHGVNTRGELADKGVDIVEEYFNTRKRNVLVHIVRHITDIVERNIEQVTM